MLLKPKSLLEAEAKVTSTMALREEYTSLKSKQQYLKNNTRALQCIISAVMISWALPKKCSDTSSSQNRPQKTVLS